jgi:nucleoside-diphosphate-sugar epimerase
MEETMKGTVLILGASGRFGRNAAEAFAQAGWQVRRFARGGDLSDAANGADVIVNGWNPPYPRWTAEVRGQVQAVIAAARATGATILMPGNVYVFGSDAPGRLTEDTPHRAQNPLGRVRIDLEAALRASDVPVILLRAGDYLDTRPSGNWIDRVILKDLDTGHIAWPGRRTDIPHAWAFLPDMARAAVALCEKRAELDRFTAVNFPGTTLGGAALADHLSAILKKPVAVRPMSWLPLRMIAPFSPMMRCLLEMRYLWDMPHRLDGARFAALLPGFVDTPPDRALAAQIGRDVGPDQRV